MSDTDATAPIVDFLNRVTAALGITATVDVEETADGPRLNLAGEEAELLVRHRGEPLKALQHVVDMAFGRIARRTSKRVFVDALDYRKGKDIELRQMAKFLAEKAKQTGARSAARPAQSLRAPHRAPGGRRSAGRDDRERRRRVLEDRSDLVTQIVAQRLAAGDGTAASGDQPPSSRCHVLHHRHHRRDCDAAGPRRHRRRAPQRARRAGDRAAA